MELVNILALVLPVVPALYVAYQGRAKLAAEKEVLIAEADKAGVSASDTITGTAINIMEQMRVELERLSRRDEEKWVEIQKLQQQDRDKTRQIQDLSEQNARHAARILHLEEENEELHKGVNVLIGQIQERGDVPRWRPRRNPRR